MLVVGKKLADQCVIWYIWNGIGGILEFLALRPKDAFLKFWLIVCLGQDVSY